MIPIDSAGTLVLKILYILFSRNTHTSAIRTLSLCGWTLNHKTLRSPKRRPPPSPPRSSLLRLPPQTNQKRKHPPPIHHPTPRHSLNLLLHLKRLLNPPLPKPHPL